MEAIKNALFEEVSNIDELTIKYHLIAICLGKLNISNKVTKSEVQNYIEYGIEQ